MGFGGGGSRGLIDVSGWAETILGWGRRGTGIGDKGRRGGRLETRRSNYTIMFRSRPMVGGLKDNGRATGEQSYRIRIGPSTRWPRFDGHDKSDC